MEGLKLELATLVSVPFEENTYVARLAPRNDCLVIDPGLEPEIFSTTWIVQAHSRGDPNTHGHGDHIAAIERSNAAGPTVRWLSAPATPPN